VVTAAGAAKINRCAFILEGGLRLKDSQAISSNGGDLEVDRCWFQGFDKAIELSAVDRMATRVQQTIIVLAPGPAQGQPRELYGWGVKVDSVGSKSRQPQLILEHCTVEGAGLLDLTTSAALALQVKVDHCAVRAEVLLASKPSKPGEPPTARFDCTGEGNQYEILERCWIVLSASQGTPAFSTAATDLLSWLHVNPKESKPIPAKLKYQIDPVARSNPARPHDFAIEAPRPPQTTPGADPDQVGPWSSK